MKYLAYIENNTKSKIISIYDVIKGLNSDKADYWKRRTYYSLNYLTPMFAKPNGKIVTPHFAFKNIKTAHPSERKKTGESIEHQLAKKVIADNGFLILKIKKTTDTIFFSDFKVEQIFNKGERKADLYVQISKKNRFDYEVNKGLVIEIHRSNKVSNAKKQFYRKKNISAIEIDIPKHIRIKDNNVPELMNKLNSYFTKQIKGSTLHDKFWKQHKKEREEREKIKLQHEREERIREYEKAELERKKKIEALKKNAVKFNKQNQDFSKINSKPKQSLFKRLVNIIFNKKL